MNHSKNRWIVDASCNAGRRRWRGTGRRCSGAAPSRRRGQGLPHVPPPRVPTPPGSMQISVKVVLFNPTKHAPQPARTHDSAVVYELHGGKPSARLSVDADATSLCIAGGAAPASVGTSSRESPARAPRLHRAATRARRHAARLIQPTTHPDRAAKAEAYGRLGSPLVSPCPFVVHARALWMRKLTIGTGVIRHTGELQKESGTIGS